MFETVARFFNLLIVATAPTEKEDGSASPRKAAFAPITTKAAGTTGHEYNKELHGYRGSIPCPWVREFHDTSACIIFSVIWIIAG